MSVLYLVGGTLFAIAMNLGVWCLADVNKILLIQKCSKCVL